MVMSQLTVELKNYIRHLMTLTTNADTAYRIAKEEMGLTRAVVRSAWRETARSEMYATLLKTWGKERTPPRAWATPADFLMRDNYMYLFEVTLYNTETKEWLRQVVAAYNPTWESFADAWKKVEPLMAKYEFRYESQYQSWSPLGIWEKV